MNPDLPTVLNIKLMVHVGRTVAPHSGHRTSKLSWFDVLLEAPLV